MKPENVALTDWNALVRLRAQCASKAEREAIEAALVAVLPRWFTRLVAFSPWAARQVVRMHLVDTPTVVYTQSCVYVEYWGVRTFVCPRADRLAARQR